MTSDRKDSASFDALWDLDLDEGKEEEIPPLLDPRSYGQRDLAAKHDAAEQNKPLDLGELDEPSVPADRYKTKRVSAQTGDQAAKLGLVMAPEEEILLPGEGAAAISDAAVVARPQRPPTQPRPPGGATRPVIAPRPPPPPARAPMTGGLRIGPSAPRPPTEPRPPTGLPVPRAPSIPPPADTGGDVVDSLDSLDSLDGLFADLSPERAEPTPEPAPAEPLHLERETSGVALFRATPARRPPSTPAFVATRSPSSAGLRLRKTGAPPEEDIGDRPTPLVDEPVPLSVVDNLREMTARFEAKNYGGALVLAESVLQGHPDHGLAKRTAESCREMLGQKYLSSLGGRTSIPRVAMSPDEMRGLALDHRAGFLLSSVDGCMSIEEILDVSSMPELDALRIMFELRQQGVIEIVEPPRRAGRK
jgi:hypothetical protein